MVQPEPAGAAVLPAEVSGLPPAMRKRVREVVVRGMERRELNVERVEPPPGRERCDEPSCVRNVLARAKSTWAINVAISGKDRVYEVHLFARGRDGETVARIDDRCEICGTVDVERTLADAADRLAQALVELSDAGEHEIAQGGSARTRRVDPAVGSPRETRVGLGSRPRPAAGDRRMPPLRIAGAVSTGIGLAGLGSGIALIVMDERPYTRDCDVDPAGRCRLRYDTLTGGAVLTSLGAALVVTGVSMLIVSRRQHRGRRR